MSTQSTRPLRAASSRDTRVLDNPGHGDSIADSLPDFDRLPQFHSSNGDFDTFLNEYFQRQLFNDEYATALRFAGSQPTGTDLLNAFEGDSWSLCWQDRTAMGSRYDFAKRLPTIGSYVPSDTVLHALLRLPVDGFGHVWSPQLHPLIVPESSRDRAKYSWPWTNLASCQPTSSNISSLFQANLPPAQWAFTDFTPAETLVGITGSVTGALPRLISPPFSISSCEMPVVEVLVRFKELETRDGLRMLGGFKLYWLTTNQNEFDEKRSVSIDDCTLSPLEYAAALKPDQTPMEPQFRLQFDLRHHKAWANQTITRLLIVPAGHDALGGDATGVNLQIEDILIIKHAENHGANADFINVSARLYAWSGDDGFLQAMIPKLRRAMLGLILQPTMQNHPLLVSPSDGSPNGTVCDTKLNIAYCAALCHMALLEKAVTDHRLPIAKGQQILSPSGVAASYTENSYSLETRAKALKLAIQTQLWNPATHRFCESITQDGSIQGDGSIALNLKALAHGLCTPAQRDCLLNWLEEPVSDCSEHLTTVLYELMARVQSFKQKQIDQAYQRVLQMEKCINLAGEQPPSADAVCLPASPDLPMGSLNPLYAFLGVDVKDPDVLTIAPAIPTDLHHISVQNVFFHGNYINIEAGKDYVTLEGSRLLSTKGLKLKVVFHNIRYNYQVFVNDNEYHSYKTSNDGSVQIPLSLGTVTVQIRPN